MPSAQEGWLANPSFVTPTVHCDAVNRRRWTTRHVLRIAVGSWVEPIYPLSPTGRPRSHDPPTTPRPRPAPTATVAVQLHL